MCLHLVGGVCVFCLFVFVAFVVVVVVGGGVNSHFNV